MWIFLRLYFTFIKRLIVSTHFYARTLMPLGTYFGSFERQSKQSALFVQSGRRHLLPYWRINLSLLLRFSSALIYPPLQMIMSHLIFLPRLKCSTVCLNGTYNQWSRYGSFVPISLISSNLFDICSTTVYSDSREPLSDCFQSENSFSLWWFKR